MDSLMVLASPWSSLPMMLKLVSVVLCPVCCMCTWMGEGCLRCFLYLSQGSLQSPLVLLIASYLVALEAVDYPTFLVLGVLVLRFHEDLFYCGVSFEVSLYAILTTCVF